MNNQDPNSQENAANTRSLKNLVDEIKTLKEPPSNYKGLKSYLRTIRKIQEKLTTLTFAYMAQKDKWQGKSQEYYNKALQARTQGSKPLLQTYITLVKKARTYAENAEKNFNTVMALSDKLQQGLDKQQRRLTQMESERFMANLNAQVAEGQKKVAENQARLAAEYAEMFPNDPPLVFKNGAPQINETPGERNNNSNINEANTMCKKFGRCFGRLFGTRKTNNKNKNKKINGGRRKQTRKN